MWRAAGLVSDGPVRDSDEVATDAAEQEQLEAFILERIEGGAKLPGTYPPNAETKAAYEAWRERRRKSSPGAG